MLETFIKQGVMIYLMGIVMLIGVLAKMISYFTVRKMVKAAKEIHKSEHRLMKLVKAKFEHASMVSDKVQNVEAFVDKYIYEYRVFGVRLIGWNKFPKKAIGLIGILGVFALFESYRRFGFAENFAENLQWTAIFILFLLLLCFLAEEKSRLDAAKNYMVEYLENVCIYRYAKMHQAAHNEKESEAEEEVLTEEVEVQTVEQQEEEHMKTEQEMRIRAILEEFLA